MGEDIKNLPEGILIKTKDGRFKVVKAGKLIDYAPAPVMTMPSESPPAGPVTLPKPTPPKPAPPTFAKPTAAYYIHPDDEEEIRLHKEKIESLTEEAPIFAVDSIIERIIAKHQLSFPDEILRKRFFSLSSSRLTDIRDAVETEEVLKRSTKVGGMGYDETLAKAVLQDLEEETAKIHSHKAGVKISEAAMVEKEAPKPVEKPPEPIMRPPIPEARPAPPPPKPPVREPETMAPPKPPEPPVMERPIPRVQEVQRPPTIPRMTRPPEAFEPAKRVVDIRKPARLVGPVEELAELSLDDFRRLGRSTAETIKKLLEKFDLLTEESITKKVEGIQAWHNSQVYQLYLNIGRKSVENQKPITEVIANETAAGTPTLTSEEFYAVTDFNKQLRF